MARVRVGSAEVDLSLRTAGFTRASKAARAETALLRNAFIALGSVLSVYTVRQLFEVGTAAEETGSKFRTVFGDATQDVQRFVDEFARMAGLTDQAAQEILATTGAIAQGMGLARRASGEFATEVVQLAGDLSSFNNVPIAETALAIQAAVTGEREQLKRLGIVVREVDVQQRALLETGKETAKQLTNEEKALATLSLIRERAGVAVGDLDRTQDSLANTTRRVVAQFRQMRDDLGVALLPIFREVVRAVGLMDFRFQLFTQAMKENAPVLAAWTRFAIGAFQQLAAVMRVPIRLAFNLGQIIGESFNATIATATGNMDALAEANERVREHMDDVKDAFVDVATASINLDRLFREAMDTFSTAGETIQLELEGIKDQFDAATAAANRFADAMRALNALSNILSFVPGGQPFATAISQGAQLITSSRTVSDFLRPAQQAAGTSNFTASAPITIDLRVTDLSGRTVSVIRDRIDRARNLDVPVVI